MPVTNNPPSEFDIEAYLSSQGKGRKFIHLDRSQFFFLEGDAADSVFYLHQGRVKISVLSKTGKEATIRLVNAGDFFGERALEPAPCQRITRATALLDCSALRIARPELIRLMREEPAFAFRFSNFLLACSMRTQADLVDQLFNRAEKRLARLLLLLAENSSPGADATLLQPISQETLAGMIGSTRPRVNAFMNRFRKLGYIEYDSRIRVRKSLLHVFLRD